MMTNFAKADEALRGAVDRHEIPGVVAMAATRDGVVYGGACGIRALPAGPAMTQDTVFWIASMTKAITSTAAMQLVERGKLSVDEAITDVLPELADKQVLEGFDAAGAPRLRPARRPITLRHLLTHTAGFAYDLWSGDLVRYQELNGIPGIITCEKLALTTPLLFDPGERWEYGINIDWVGIAVERTSGKKLGDYFHDHLFGPIGMTDTVFRLGADQRARLVGMSSRQTDGKLAPLPFEIPQDPEFQMGGGGLYGTASDYLTFARVFLNDGRADGNELLKRETVDTMSQNQIGDLNVRKLVTAIPPYTNDAEFFPGMVKKWGFGFMINTQDVPQGRRAGSLAWAGLGNTYFWIDRRSGIAGVILTQLVPFADAKVLDLFGEFERAVYGALA